MLAEQADFNQVVQVVLETLYRAFGLRRVTLALRDPAHRQFVGRIGFGEGIEDFLRRLRFSESYERDVFHLALKRQTDLHIADLHEEKVVESLPAWYRGAGVGGALLFLPMVVRQRTVGCILAEHLQPHGIDLGSDNLRVARALRNQLVLGLQVAQARSL
jgi:GAF domain-containing protein